jgi:hypothetical protein
MSGNTQEMPGPPGLQASGDVAGHPIWTEINYPNETPTVFEVIGTTPITDPFGNVLAYNSSMKRSENQQIG